MELDVLLKAILASTTDYVILVTDTAGKLVTCNSNAQHVVGLSPAMAGLDCAATYTEDDQQDSVPAKEMAAALQAGQAIVDRAYVRQDGSRFWGAGNLTPLYDESRCHIGFLSIFRDVTEKRRGENEILRVVNTDTLTGLANRFSFNEHLKEWTKASVRADQAIILHMIDLDHFKVVNDTLGHHAGDVLLQKVGARIKSVTRETDFVARLGGDEFAVLQAGAASAMAGSSLAEKILAAFAQPFDLEGQEARTTPSIGIAVAPQDSWTPDQLMRKADAALYRVKREGGNQYGYFTEALDLEAHRRSRDIAALRHAVTHEEFHLVYQPTVSVTDGTLVAVEALLRCDHPVLHDRPISDVILLATQCGLALVLGRWIMQQACCQASIWFDQGLPRFRMCVNLCARELSDPKMPAIIDDVLKRTGLLTSDLMLELTERDLFESKEEGLKVLQSLNRQGISIALDDFGTGYSSLGNLTTLPINCIKLDGSFAGGIPENLQSCTVVKAIIGLAHSLGLKVVAEGVETGEQLAFFKQEQCDIIQGHYCSPPLPPDEMTAWMQQRV